MKLATVLKFSAIILVFLAALFIIISPKLLELEKVQEQIIAKIEKDFSSSVTVSDVRWRWFPLPYLSIAGLRLKNPFFDLESAEVRLRPYWKSLIRRDVTVGRTKLIAPVFHLKTLPHPEKHYRIILPRTSLMVENGTLIIDPPDLPPFIRPGSLTFTKVKAEVVTAPDLLQYTFRGSSPFSERLLSKGHYNFSSNAYSIDIGSSLLQMDALLNSEAERRFTPTAKPCNASGHIEGEGRAKMRADFKGDFPSFTVAFNDRSLALDTGFADFSLTKAEEDFSITIRQIVVNGPAFLLSGRIARTKPEKSTEDETNGPVWQIDLKAKDLDVTAIRQGVMALWGDHPVTREVCGIVLGGRAKTASYSFKGTVPDFKHVENMTIAVDVETSTIMVPKAKLYLTDAKGPIRIVAGYLTGSGLSAYLNNSYGYNCELLTGVTDKHKRFKLDLDIDGDLVELPPILDRLVNHDGFRRELHRFSNVSGRAKGNLKLGDIIDKLSAEVDVKQMRVSADYQRISWPLDVLSGTLHVLKDEVEWRNVKGTAGPNTILNAGGSVSWKDRPLLNIERVDAKIDAASLYDELTGRALASPKKKKKKPAWLLNSSPIVPQSVPKVLTSIEGPLEIRNLYLKGDATHPDTWQYGMDVSLAGVRWESPLLPSSVLTINASAAINRKGIVLHESNSWFLDQVVKVNGDFNHSRFRDWQGWVTLNATIRDAASQWVKDEGWVPEEYFPRTPCRLSDLKISWSPGTTGLSGRILSGTKGTDVPRAVLDLQTTRDSIKIREIRFVSSTSEGRLSAELLRTKPEKVTFSWNGRLDSATADALLASNTIMDGFQEGKYTLNLGPQADKPLFSGALTARDVSRFWGIDLAPLRLDRIMLSGENNRIKISSLDFSFNEQAIAAQGSINLTGPIPELALIISSNDLSNLTLAQFLEYLKEQADTMTPVPDRKKSPATEKKPFPVKGRIDFRSERFTLNPEPADPLADMKPAQAFTPLAGTVELFSHDRIAAEIREANLCGIPVQGKWFSEDALGDRTLFSKTDPENPPRFERVMPCLGLKKSLIQGDLHLDLAFQGNSKGWQTGHADIHSPRGYIQRLALLSKIFSVVNITDLFKDTGMQDLAVNGFPYSSIDIETRVENNALIIEKGVIRGDGLNLFGKGNMELKNFGADITLLVSPFKTLDAIVSRVPVVGRVIGGKNATVITIPVSLSGNIMDLKVRVLEPDDVGDGVVNLVKDIIKIPYFILEPILPKEKNNRRR